MLVKIYMPNDELVEYKLLEEAGRNKASDLNAYKPSKSDMTWFTQLSTASYDMAHYFDKTGMHDWARFLRQVAEAANDGKYHALDCEIAGSPRMQCSANKSTIEDVNYRGKQVTFSGQNKEGKSCAWLIDVVPEYKFTSYINDLTACFHRGIEKYEETARNWHKKGKCVWRT